MKVGELEIKKKLIKEKGLIKKCKDVSLLGKQTFCYERDYSTHVVWEYGVKDNFIISSFVKEPTFLFLSIFSFLQKWRSI